MDIYDISESLLRLGIFFFIVLLCGYVILRKRYIEGFLGFSDFVGIIDDKIIDKGIEKIVLKKKCEIKTPGFDCLRVGYFCYED